ncbi:DUF3095 domain-containing protein [Methylobacterium sp. J-068]|uniref:DUF3095 domain-containing protein n=1 Tax=Methylobacterium sp. J-068 TaxID=2836649 RepID=UPI001FBB02DA|nr:DUF3095 domain-containing protein [Methylobacterium sp. J-068]MCJ2036437.1 DUF3095 domain-containing protein [Methylobacterium sp. J-068]
MTAPFRYADVPRLTRFSDVLDETRYVPVPNTWWIALCDVVMSTRAIEDGRYRSVNIAGAALITAVNNALPGADLPFVFGGDGATLLAPPEHRDTVESLLAETVTWVREALGLDLRAALIPVSAVREAGQNLRIARYAASAHVDYAMFSGGGVAYADAAMKRGLHAVPAAPAGAQPDLSGLSCRFEAVPAARDGLVLSLIALPREGADPEAVLATLGAILAEIDASPGMGRPLPESGPSLRPPWSGLVADARAEGRLLGSRFLRGAAMFVTRGVAFALFGLGLSFGRFSAVRYRRRLAANADFRKYDDGLRLTVACPVATADRIEARLALAQEAGLVRYGVHRQDAAVVTCVSPSVLRDDHVHFVDGADGGYARAAAILKRRP